MITLSRSRIVVAAVVALVLAACATRQDMEAPEGTVRIAPTLFMTLPKPSDLGRSVETTQLVTAHYRDKTFVFEGHISATPEQFLLVGLDPTGNRALTLTWTDQKLSVETASTLPSQLHPENMLADIVILCWPEDSLRRALAGSTGVLTVTPNRRSITVDGKEVIRADYQTTDPWNGSMIYRNIAWGYELDVQSAEQGR
ncbi:MAG TPA: DUF3261 domain-containing protein [Magnetospirillaceae bacterium]